MDGEFSVAESGKESAEASDGVRDDDRGTGIDTTGTTGGDKNSGADHSADSESNEIIPPESTAHLLSGDATDAAHLVGRRGDRNSAAG